MDAHLPAIDGRGLACWAAALALTLVLASMLTPRRWWRRPNLGALAVVGGGTLAFALALGTLCGAVFAPAPVAAAQPVASVPAPLPPAAVYYAADALNLRGAASVRAARMAVLAAGTPVTATGERDGDWWRVHASVDGRTVDGWASSLWLRRDDERGRRAR